MWLWLQSLGKLNKEAFGLLSDIMNGWQEFQWLIGVLHGMTFSFREIEEICLIWFEAAMMGEVTCSWLHLCNCHDISLNSQNSPLSLILYWWHCSFCGTVMALSHLVNIFLTNYGKCHVLLKINSSIYTSLIKSGCWIFVW